MPWGQHIWFHFSLSCRDCVIYPLFLFLPLQNSPFISINLHNKIIWQFQILCWFQMMLNIFMQFKYSSNLKIPAYNYQIPKHPGSSCLHLEALSLIPGVPYTWNLYRYVSLGWWDGTECKVFAMLVCRPEFDPRNHMRWKEGMGSIDFTRLSSAPTTVLTFSTKPVLSVLTCEEKMVARVAMKPLVPILWKEQRQGNHSAP